MGGGRVSIGEENQQKDIEISDILSNSKMSDIVEVMIAWIVLDTRNTAFPYNRNGHDRSGRSATGRGNRSPHA
jgi:hypothetical protein